MSQRPQILPFFADVFYEGPLTILLNTLPKVFIIELEMNDAQARKRKRIEEMRKKPTQKPDFKSLMKDIDSFRYGFKTKLKKTQCNDRSQPFIGSGLKVQGKVSTIQIKISSNGSMINRKSADFYQIILSFFLTFQYIYDSEQEAANSDIFHDIKKGVRLKKVKTNDRSRPVLQGRTRSTSILGKVRNVEIPGPTQQLLCSKYNDFPAILALAHSKINQIA